MFGEQSVDLLRCLRVQEVASAGHDHQVGVGKMVHQILRVGGWRLPIEFPDQHQRRGFDGG